MIENKNSPSSTVYLKGAEGVGVKVMVGVGVSVGVLVGVLVLVGVKVRVGVGVSVANRLNSNLGAPEPVSHMTNRTIAIAISRMARPPTTNGPICWRFL
ncbi:MAG TPA: hypothetical protein DCG54_05795 [Anaerolineae bacterium]|nr:hypothetical protein [Anaerolineae bacterium]